MRLRERELVRRSRTGRTEGSRCTMFLSAEGEPLTLALEQDKALIALKRRKMQGKLIEKTDEQVGRAPLLQRPYRQRPPR